MFGCIFITLLAVSAGSCENIAFGKTAKQSSTFSGYGAARALNSFYSASGSLTNFNSPSWWEVDLRGYYTVDNITLVAVNNGWINHMKNAYVEVMDKDIDLCPDTQVMWCGNVSATVAYREEFIITCDPPFPVRFIRVYRPGSNLRLSVGHIDVRGSGATKRYRSYYEPTVNRKVTQAFMTTSAMTAGDCGIQCHQHHNCLHFSFSTTAPSDANCMMTYKAVPQFSVSAAGWKMYTHNDCR